MSRRRFPGNGHLKTQMRLQHSAESIKHEVVILLQGIPTKLKLIQDFLPLVPEKQSLPQIDQQIPLLGGDVWKKFFHNPRGLNPPRSGCAVPT